MIKVKDYPNLLRDPKSKAIVNINKNAYNEHIQKNLVKNKLASMDNEINTIKHSINEIKDLIIKLADKK
tara:strand:- start:12 stop:218 length:207 start_codon:yes stop_codon:yes gene_type:complete